jgi:hypothetical protein
MDDSLSSSSWPWPSARFSHRGSPTDTPGSESEEDFYLNGRIDEVQMAVGHALAPDQIKNIFQAGRSGVCF